MRQATHLEGTSGIIFDLDDTLYPQESFKRSGFVAVSNWAQQQLDIPAHSCLSELEQIMAEEGASYPTMFDLLAKRLGLAMPIVKEMIRQFIEHKPQIECYPGAWSLLNRLRDNYNVGILTDGRRTTQEQKIQALKLEQVTDAILCSDSLSLSKPAEALYAWFEDKFDLPGAQLAYVGDNPAKDFIGARARGWKTVRVLTGEYAQKPAQRGYDGDITLNSVVDVKKLCKEVDWNKT